MTKEPVISMEELELQLRELGAAQPEGFSVAEMSDQIGMSEYWCRVRLRKLIHSGTAKFNGKKSGRMIDGRRSHAPVYIITEVDTAVKERTNL